MVEKGRHAGVGAGFIGGAALLGLGALGAATACLIALLATAIDHVWLSALIVAVVYGAIAGVLALRGKGQDPGGRARCPRTDRRHSEGGRRMGQDPDAIRREIEQTRERMGETVEAIGYKTDAPARTKEKVSDTFTGVKDRIGGAASAIGSVAFGFLAGMLSPGTRVEQEKIGPVADHVMEQARQTGHEALEHGKQVAQEVASTVQESAQQVTDDVKQTAQQAAQEHGEQLKESAQQSARQVREQAPTS
jgi:gas vesicle protein